MHYGVYIYFLSILLQEPFEVKFWKLLKLETDKCGTFDLEASLAKKLCHFDKKWSCQPYYFVDADGKLLSEMWSGPSLSSTECSTSSQKVSIIYVKMKYIYMWQNNVYLQFDILLQRMLLPFHQTAQGERAEDVVAVCKILS